MGVLGSKKVRNKGILASFSIWCAKASAKTPYKNFSIALG
jgi:hypothetical protein